MENIKKVLINSDSGHKQITQGGGRSLNDTKLNTGGPSRAKSEKFKSRGKKIQLS